VPPSLLSTLQYAPSTLLAESNFAVCPPPPRQNIHDVYCILNFRTIYFLKTRQEFFQIIFLGLLNVSASNTTTHLALLTPSPKGGGEVVLGDGSRHPILQGLEGLLGQRPGSQILHDVQRKKAVGARLGRWRRCSMSRKLLAAIKSFTTVVMVQTGTLH
jgi:hypothetical protein